MNADDNRTLTMYGSFGRDAGKLYEIQEIDPLTLSGYVLRLVSALRVDSYETLLDDLGSVDGGPPIDTIMRVLRGADPTAVHGLLTELVKGYVRISPDPQHPGVLRPLQVSSDIREIRTLGELLMALFKLNFGSA